jgi:ABC-type branched-subunit amino acid transport system ATPase component
LKADIPEAGYGKKVVLKNIGLNVGQGKIVALIGPNGAGKSTLLKVLIGILKIPHGTISVDGKDITNHSPERNVKDGISFIPQGNRVFDELSVYENLEVGGYLLSKSEVPSRIQSVIEIFPDIKDRLKQNAGKLSGGEKQQLALARALMLQPKILLMDEPSLGLSPKLVEKAFATIQDINQKFGTTVLIVEQKVREVLKIAHYVYALRMGEIAFKGTPSELNSEELKKVFLV